MIEFRALGSLGVAVDGQETSIGGARQRRLLAVLLIHHNDVVSVDRLADAVFAGEPSEAAATTMRSYIARIRRVLGGATADVSLLTKAPGYALEIGPACFDVTRFEHLLEEGRRQLATDDAALAVTTLRAALDLWAGQAYAEFADEEWAFTEAQRLEELRLVALERLVDAELACGRAAETIARLDALVAEHPLRESFRAQQMLALHRAGRQADALRAFRAYRETLIDEIGLEPSPNLVELERRILDHDPTLNLTEAAGEPLRGYRRGRRLGSGPNGTMYVATVPGGVHERIISILTDPSVDRVDFVRSFEERAQLIASLSHPAIVPLQDYWRQPGAAYVVSRRVVTETLRERIERGSLSRADVVEVATQIGGALAEAASHGIEHGWITLDNIVVDDDGFAITNFVVCPRTTGHDAADLATVLRSCVRAMAPPLGGAQRVAADDALDREHRGVPELVECFTHALTAEHEPSHGRPPNPYKGLRAFEETDADHFHGREALVDELVDRITAGGPGARLTLVVGGSGSGKSSVVRAGVIPAMRRACAGVPWLVTTMLPGGAPFKELAEAIRRIAVVDIPELAEQLRDGRLSLDDAVRLAGGSDGRLLLVIDQFEEVFTLSTDADQAAFVDVLADSAESESGIVHVVGTLRADFYDRPLAMPRFGTLVGPATCTVAAMTASELEAAIVRPVEAIGATAEPALVAELVAAVNDQVGALPALQFTLYELAERRADRSLTLADFRQLGGLDEAIASRAEALYLSHDDTGRELVRTIFEQLVAIDVGVEATGRRAARTDLLAGTDTTATNELLERWTTARLLSSDHDPRSRVPTVQVAHEALLRSWPRLRRWIIEDRESILEFQHLREAAAAWEQLGRDEGALYRGTNLGRAVLTATGREHFPPVEQEFLDASIELRDREEREARERVEQQQRANRRLRMQLGVIAFALVGALVVGFLAIDQRGQARSERDEADDARRDAIARELVAAAESNLDIDPERSILLALEAVETSAIDGAPPLPTAVDVLHRAVTSARVLVNVPDVGGRMDWDPTRPEFVTEGPEESGIVDIRSTVTGESVRSWRGDDIDVNEVTYSADGSMLVVAGDDGVLKVFDPATGDLMSTVEGTGSVWDASFDDSGSLVLAQWTTEQKIRLANPRTGELIGEIDGAVKQFEISPDGKSVAVANPPADVEGGGVNGVGIVDTATSENKVLLELGTWIEYVTWSPDGAYVAAVGQDGVVRVIDTAGEIVAAAAAGPAAGTVAMWSPDGTQLATGGLDGIVRVWDFDGTVLLERQHIQIQDLANGVADIAFSPDGGRLAVSDWDITSTKIVDIGPLAGAEVVNVPADPWLDGTFVGDELIVGASSDGVLEAHRISGLSAGDAEPASAVAVDRRFGANVVGLPGAVLDPSRTLLAVALDQQDRIEVRHVASGGLATAFEIAPGEVQDLDWSTDGERLIYTQTDPDWDGSRVVVTDRDGSILAAREFDGVHVGSISFSADGERAALMQASTERSDPVVDVIKIWDWAADQMTDEIPLRAYRVEFDPTGRYLAATNTNVSSSRIYDATTFEPIATLSGSTTPHLTIAFNSTGTQVAAGGADGVIRIWDPATGERLQTLHAPGAVRGLAYDESGTRLLSLDESMVGRVWTLDLDTLIDAARARLTRDLTPAECEQYLHRSC